jgi:hypothetical protein
MLFTTKPTFVNPPPQPPSSLGYQPFSTTLPYPHQYQQQQQQQQQQQGYSYGGGFNSTVKRSSSAFEPLFYQQQQQQHQEQHHQRHQQQQGLPTSFVTPSTSVERLPTLADFAATIIYLMWHARKPSLMVTSKASSPYRHSFSSVSGNASPAFKRFCLQVNEISDSLFLPSS